MCGFVSYEQQTITETPELFERLPSLEMALKTQPDYRGYPAFGGDASKTIPLIIKEQGHIIRVPAIWWYDVDEVLGNDVYLGKRTSFNARNLDSPFWKGALKRQRGLVVASHLGESKLVGKTKHQYLMQSQQPFFLGALFRRLENGAYCCAIITRDAHPKMSPYHDKAFPLFLPPDNDFLQDWLTPSEYISPRIDHLLNEPKLFPNLHVQRVKTYKSMQPVGKVSDHLVSDTPELIFTP